MPNLSGELARFEKLNYAELCFEFFKHFATDIPQETLRAIIAQSYTKFSHPDIAPLVQLDERTYVLEQDMAVVRRDVGALEESSGR